MEPFFEGAPGSVATSTLSRLKSFAMAAKFEISYILISVFTYSLIKFKISGILVIVAGV